VTVSEPHPPPRGQNTDGEVRRDRYVGGRDLTRWTSRPGRRITGLVDRLGRIMGPYRALVLILAIGAAIAATTTWLASETYEAVTEADGVAALDRPVLDAMMALRSPAADALATAYTNIAGVIVLPILAATTMAAMALRR
jgi:hypothetical protein